MAASRSRTCALGARTLTFGQSCAGGNGVAKHDALTTPEIGKGVAYHLSKGPKSQPTTLAIGFSDSAWSGVPLPFALAGFGAPGCNVYVPQTIAFATSTYADGSAAVTVPMPNNLSLIGARLFTQFMSVDPGANTLGVTLSNGLETKLGGWR